MVEGGHWQPRTGQKESGRGRKDLELAASVTAGRSGVALLGKGKAQGHTMLPSCLGKAGTWLRNQASALLLQREGLILRARIMMMMIIKRNIIYYLLSARH